MSMGIIGIVDLLLIFNFLDTTLLKYALVLAGLVLLFYAMRHLFRKNRIALYSGGGICTVALHGRNLAGPFCHPWRSAPDL